MPKCHKKKLEPYNPTTLHHFKFRYILYALVFALSGLALPTKAKTNLSCHDVNFIYIPASGQTADDNDDWRAFKSAVLNRFTAHGLSFTIGPLKYPAVSISDQLLPLVFTKSAKSYNASVATGIKNLKHTVNEIKTSCKNTKFAFAGFSQGAQVLSTTLFDLNPDDILFAATMGDPTLYLPEGKRQKGQTTPDACESRNLSPYRTNVPDCHAVEGWLGGRNPYVKDSMINKVGAWCADGDPICSSQVIPTLKKSFTNNSADIKKAALSLASLNKNSDSLSKKANDLIYSVFQAHDSYHKTGAYDEAVDYMLDRAAAAFPEKHLKTLEPLIKTTNDVALLIDTTNVDPLLVRRYLDSARQLAANTYSKNGRVALYVFNSDPENPVTPLCDFSCTRSELEFRLSELSLNLLSPESQAPRPVFQGSLNIMNQLSWKSGANKSLVIFTNKAYDNSGLGGATLTKVVQLSRSIDPVNFYAIGTTSAAYQELTAKTGGQAFSNPDADLEFILNRPAAIITPKDSTSETFTLADFKDTFATLGQELDALDSEISPTNPSNEDRHTAINNPATPTSPSSSKVPLAPNSGYALELKCQ